MTDARIKEIESQLASARERASQADRDARAADYVFHEPEANAYRAVGKQLYVEIGDLAQRLAYLKAGLAEDHGKPKPAPVRAAPPAPVTKNSAPPQPSKPRPVLVPYPADQPVERRQEIIDEQIEIVVRWAVENNPSENELYSWAVAMAASTIVQHSWAMDRIRTLETRLADIEAGAARKSASPSGKKLDDLSARVRELEAGGLIYCGVWKSTNNTYRKNAVCTHAGSAWIAKREAREGEEPGTSPAWQLAVKRGRDGRNAR